MDNEAAVLAYIKQPFTSAEVQTSISKIMNYGKITKHTTAATRAPKIGASTVILTRCWLFLVLCSQKISISDFFLFIVYALKDH